MPRQLSGPYALWHHTHAFTPVPEGTRMRDRVRYRMPLGILGALGLPLVHRDLGGSSTSATPRWRGASARPWLRD